VIYALHLAQGFDVHLPNNQVLSCYRRLKAAVKFLLAVRKLQKNVYSIRGLSDNASTIEFCGSKLLAKDFVTRCFDMVGSDGRVMAHLFGY